jgi:hypothetical protein
MEDAHFSAGVLHVDALKDRVRWLSSPQRTDLDTIAAGSY